MFGVVYCSHRVSMSDNMSVVFHVFWRLADSGVCVRNMHGRACLSNEFWG